jgi:hypothetical protein
MHPSQSRREEEIDEQNWIKKSEEILSDIKEWRQAHPKATYVEIEDEVHRRLMELEAQVLADAAQASESREWGRRTNQQAPRCPKCGKPRPRARETAANVARQWGTECGVEPNLRHLPPLWGEFFSRLYEELGLLPGSLAPRQ